MARAPLKIFQLPNGSRKKDIMAKMTEQEIQKMKAAPCYPGTRLVEQEDGSYLVVQVPCPPDCYCKNKCTEEEF